MNEQLTPERYLALAVTGPAADQLALMLLALVLGAIGVILLRDHPKMLAVIWLVGLVFVPIWMGVTFRVYLAPSVIIAVFVGIALFPTQGVRLGKADMVMLLMLVLSLATVVLGGASRPALLDVLLQWLPPLAMGRLLAQRLGLNWLMKAIGVVFAIAAALAVVEFITGYNIFVLLMRGNSLYGTWGSLQARGDIVRAEGAFGHSIALGASLAAAIPLALATDLTARAKSVIVLVLLAGTLVSFSRAAMLCAVTGLVLTIVFQRFGLSARLRALFTVLLFGVAFFALPYVTAVFDAAGSEAAGSAAYRGNLLALIPDMAPLGISPAAYRAPDGTLYMRDFHSIDSTLILHGLSYGWLPLVVTSGLLLAAIVCVVTRRASAPTVALVAQIPALATVALITQYAAVIWMIVGMALFAPVLKDLGRDSSAAGPRRRHRYGDDGFPPPRLRVLSSPNPVAEPMHPSSSDGDAAVPGRASASSLEGSGA